MMRSLLLALLASGLSQGCAPRAPSARMPSDIRAISSALDALSRGTTDGHERHFQALLVDNLEKDAPFCAPPVSQVLAAPLAAEAPQRVQGTMPHYGWYYGPMVYRVGVATLPTGELVRQVRLNVALELRSAEMIELPDCTLAGKLEGPMRCEGTPYEQASGVEACPRSGRFEAPARRSNVRAMLAWWSTAVEAHYNRDARYFGLPVRYDFEFFLADEGSSTASVVDIRLPLWLSCGRTPYFFALRSGWSLSVVAHEVGHYLGLLDEYEALSGISDIYPKKPFTGSENSRMGLSMKPHTRFFPLHHYLVLRRHKCLDRAPYDPYRDVLSGGAHHGRP